LIETLCETVNESRQSFFIYQMNEVLRIRKKERKRKRKRRIGEKERKAEKGSRRITLKVV
jgi:hypothetical protein